MYGRGCHVRPELPIRVGSANGLSDNNTTCGSDRGSPYGGFLLRWGRVHNMLPFLGSVGWRMLISTWGLLLFLLCWWSCARDKPFNGHRPTGYHVAFSLLGFYFGGVNRFSLCLLGWLNHGTKLFNRPMNDTSLKTATTTKQQIRF